jgi:hypothetical protein
MFGGLSTSAFGHASGSQGIFDNKEEEDDGYPPPSSFVSTVAGVPVGEQVWHDSRRFATQQAPTGHPHGPETRICGGVIARGTQGQFPDCFCLKTRCTFSSHVSKSNLNWLVRGAYYVRENNSYPYLEFFLSPEVATLAPPEVLGGVNKVLCWKAIIQQLEDQLATGLAEPAVAATLISGIVEIVERVLKTPYTITPMRALRCRPRIDEEKDEEEEAAVSTMKSGLAMELLQRLKDSVGYFRRELGVCSPNARYITLHGCVGALGDNFVRLHKDLTALGYGLLLAAEQNQLAQEEAPGQVGGGGNGR